MQQPENRCHSFHGFWAYMPLVNIRDKQGSINSKDTHGQSSILNLLIIKGLRI